MKTVRFKEFKGFEDGRVKTLLKVSLLLFVVLFVSISHIPYSGDVNIIKKDDLLPRIYPDECIRWGISDLHKGKDIDWITCLRAKELITNTINFQGSWEPSVVRALSNILTLYPTAAYLDIGANVGPHVAMAAKYPLSRVYAVDPSQENLAYIRHSLELEGTEDKVVLINNVLSDSKTVLYPFQPSANNNAWVYYLKEDEIKNKKEKNYVSVSYSGPIKTVTLQELLDVIPEQNIILKIDVEGSECKVLSDYLSKENKEKYIPFILMEWKHISANREGLCPDLKSFIQKFVKAGYTPMTVTSLASSREYSLSDLNPPDGEFKDMDVMWIHESNKIKITKLERVYKKM